MSKVFYANKYEKILILLNKVYQQFKNYQFNESKLKTDCTVRIIASKKFQISRCSSHKCLLDHKNYSENFYITFWFFIWIKWHFKNEVLLNWTLKRFIFGALNIIF